MPGATAPAVPVALIVATVIGVMLQVPPEGVEERTSVAPGQSGAAPVMGVGAAPTVMVAVTEPHTVVYVARAVPVAIAVTLPVALIVATVVGAMLQVPPGTLLLRPVLLPGHSGVLPAMVSGSGFTVITTVAVPQAVV